jgi:hypothetical protein
LSLAIIWFAHDRRFVVPVLVLSRKSAVKRRCGKRGFQRVSDEARRHSMNKNKIGKWRKR